MGGIKKQNNKKGLATDVHRYTQMGEFSFGKERDDLSEKIIGASFRVQNNLGTGFLEKVINSRIKEK